MKNLAIKGHAIRGNEVIALLGMLGGVNTHNLYGGKNYAYYTIDSDGEIKGGIYVFGDEDLLTFTLEEFLAKYPYKVGDKVNYVKYNDGYPSVYTIQRMRWTGRTVEYLLDSNGFTALAKDLQPYKEEAMKKEISGAIIDRFICLEGYDFYDDKGNIIDTKEITMKKKKTQYPKTYKKCCEVLGMQYNLYLSLSSQNIDGEVEEKSYGYKIGSQMNSLYELLVCRDAYWKMAGDWEPSDCQIVYGIRRSCGKFEKVDDLFGGEMVLEFPSREMRDAFYENFKELIEVCKELI
jgi:hypothetical protein